MTSVSQALRVQRYQELNEPYIFSWRYLAGHLGADELFPFELCWYKCRRVPPVRVVVTLRWRNKAHRVAELVAYDEENGYCLLGQARFPEKPKPDIVAVRTACARHGQAYLNRLYDVAHGQADGLHEESRRNYKKYKGQLKRKLGLGVGACPWGKERETGDV